MAVSQAHVAQGYICRIMQNYDKAVASHSLAIPGAGILIFLDWEEFVFSIAKNVPVGLFFTLSISEKLRGVADESE